MKWMERSTNHIYEKSGAAGRALVVNCHGTCLDLKAIVDPSSQTHFRQNDFHDWVAELVLIVVLG